MTASTLPLEGVRVLDLSRILAAPFATQMMGDMGARVIKVERPDVGDDARNYGPGFLQDPEGSGRAQSSFYMCANRNKESITVDLASPRGQDIVRRLAAQSDVVIENYRVGTLERYGLDFSSLAQVNPGIIYCSITAYGQSGPYKDRPGYDAIFQAAGGLMSVTGHPDGVPGAGPMKVGPSIVDVMTGYNAVAAILAALRHRDMVSGKGQHIDLALLDVAVASASHYPMQYLVTGSSPIRKGTQGNGGMPCGVFYCADNPVMLAVGNDRQFRKFCAVLGKPDMAADDRFATVVARSDHRVELVALLEPMFATWDATELVRQLNDQGVPICMVNDYEMVFKDEQSVHRGLAASAPHPYDPALEVIASPIRFSDTPITSYRAPPLLGEHTDHILSEDLGLSPVEIQSLREESVI